MRFPALRAAVLLASLSLLAVPAFAAPDTVPSSPEASVPAAREAAYRGNFKSKVFHKTGCRHAACKACTKVFTSETEAREAGYHPCKVCLSR